MKKQLILLVLIFISCENNETKKKLTKIDLSEVQSKINFSELYKIDSMMPLKYGDFSIFGEVTTAFPFGDKILVHTAIPPSITLVDQKGHLYKQYVPDYLIKNISAVSIFMDNIFILDRGSMKIHVLDNKLNHQKAFSIPFFGQSFSMLEENIAALYVGNETTENTGRLILFDLSSSKVIADELEISANQKRYFNFMTNYNFLKINNKPYFWNSPQNEIYEISAEGNVSEAFLLDYGSKGVPPKFYENAKYQNPYEFLTDARKKGFSHRHFILFSNDQYIFIQFDYGDEFATTIFSIDTKEAISFNDIFDDKWTHSDMQVLELSFIVGLYGKNSFLAFLPHEFAAASGKKGESDYLVFGKIKPNK